jgi:hypothetical protein
MEKKEKEIIILTESVIGSIIKDIVTFLMFGGLLYFNHKVLSGNGWIDFTFIVLIFMWLSTLKLSQVFKGNRADAIEWLKYKENK